MSVNYMKFTVIVINSLWKEIWLLLRKRDSIFRWLCNSDSESIVLEVAHICLHLYGETATDRIRHDYMQWHHKQGNRNCCVLHRTSNTSEVSRVRSLVYPVSQPCDPCPASLNKWVVWTCRGRPVERLGARPGCCTRCLSPLKMRLTTVQVSLCMETSKVFTDTGQIVTQPLTVWARNLLGICLWGEKICWVTSKRC